MDNLSLERLFLQNISETNQIFTTDIWELATHQFVKTKKTRTCICLNIQGSSHHWWTGFLQITSSSQFPSILRWGGPRKWVQSKQNISIFLTTKNFLAQNYRRCFSPRKLLITGGVPDGDTFSADKKSSKQDEIYWAPPVWLGRMVGINRAEKEESLKPKCQSEVT